MSPSRLSKPTTLILLALMIVQAGGVPAFGQRRRNVGPATLGLEQGIDTYRTPHFVLRLVRASQTVAALKPRQGDEEFDFTPGDRLESRAADGFFHLGDLTFRWRRPGQTDWTSVSTAAARHPVTALTVQAPLLAAADLGATLPADCPLRVVREWSVTAEGDLALTFVLTNAQDHPIEIGALGIPLIFNNDIRRRSLEEAHRVCSFSDPAICRDGGYVQVTRLNGQGPALVVVPQPGCPLEGYRPLLEDPTRRGQTFEGFYEWMPHTLAYAENEWRRARPWNDPTQVTLAPGRQRRYGLRLLLSPTIRQIEATLAAAGRPVAVAVPGTILPMDQDGSLMVQSPQPIASVTVTPPGALQVTRMPNQGPWQRLSLRGLRWGRARVDLSFADGQVQTVHYKVVKPSERVLADLGRFLTTEAWYDNPDDPFGRSPAVMNYDRQARRIVLEDARAWIAGLGDEGGTGGWVTAIMKQLGQPDPEEVRKLERFMNECLWGRLQVSEGPQKYGVRKSLFYYEPNAMPAGTYRSDIPYGGWSSWSRREAFSLGRTFNYPHVAAAHWVFYRLARHHEGLVTTRPWSWYLENAARTILAAVKFGPHYAQFGLMEGSVFIQILRDLREEGFDELAQEVEATMRARAEHWRSLAYPFGSEMAWDSTGQEEVYGWCKFFGFDPKAQVTLDAILGYMPTVPHWGYNGNARRYWDFIYGAAPGPTSRIERQIHHYGSSMNAIPVLHAFRETPEDRYLLRVGYGGLMGTLSNIDPNGCPSAAFHAWPDTLAPDAMIGDFGPNFFGHAFNVATYVVQDPQFGWTAFGGNVETDGSTVRIRPRDSFRQRLYLAPWGTWLTLDSGHFAAVELDPANDRVRLRLDPATPFTPRARLRVEHPAQRSARPALQVVSSLRQERNAFVVDLQQDRPTDVVLATSGSQSARSQGARVTAPPESFFELVARRPRWGRRRSATLSPEDLQVYRGFYRKYLDVMGMPVVAAEEVSDEALYRTREIVSHMLAGRPDIVQGMRDRGMYLVIIGKDQVYCDLPENRDIPNKDFMNERVRGTGGHPTSFGEENLLSLPIDRYDDESIAVHEFCHTIDSTLRRVDPGWNDRRMEAYNQAKEKGLYKDTYAIGNPAEYWAEIAQAYFNCNRVNNWNHGPIGTREQLKIYDPLGYELCRTTFNLRPEQDWRYQWLQPLPKVEAPPAKFHIDPYYTKFTWAREFTVIGRQASDEALLRANDTIRKLFAYRHDILKALMAANLKLVVLGPNESLADLPEASAMKAAGVDLLARYLEPTAGIDLLVVSQENVLGDLHRPDRTECQVLRVFAKAIYQVTGRRPVDPNWEQRRDVQQYELRVQRMDRRFDERLGQLFQASVVERGHWRGTAACHDRVEYWTAGLLAYFDAVGGGVAPNDADAPITTRRALKDYDPELYRLVHETMAYGGKVDWRHP